MSRFIETSTAAMDTLSFCCLLLEFSFAGGGGGDGGVALLGAHCSDISMLRCHRGQTNIFGATVGSCGGGESQWGHTLLTGVQVDSDSI